MNSLDESKLFFFSFLSYQKVYFKPIWPRQRL